MQGHNVLKGLALGLLLPVVAGCAGADGDAGKDGKAGANALVSLTDEPAGTNCANGGQKVEYGADLNGNKKLDDDEIEGTKYVCNGADGAKGADGADGAKGADGADGATFATLVNVTPEPFGSTHCPYGGTKVEVGLDNGDGGETANDAILGAGEVDSTTYICTLAKRVFVTSTTVAGDFGGVSGGDAVCQGLATDAGLTGTYRAWLDGDAGDLAPTHVAATNTSGLFVLMDGTLVTSAAISLTSGALAHAIHITEKGDTAPANTLVWTDARPGGAASGLDCNNWTSAASTDLGGYGDPTSTGSAWTSDNFATCDSKNALYCFEQ